MLVERSYCTREICQRCHRVSPIGFHARQAIWEAVRWPRLATFDTVYHVLRSARG